MSSRSSSVLLADPQPSSRRALRRQLEDAGYSVQAVTTADEVILRCGLEPPDVLILDVRLPGMDGFDLCEYVRHEMRDADVTVILTAEPSDEMTRTYLGQMVDYVGGDYFLAKPCDGKLLAQLLDDLVAEGDGASYRSRAVFPTRMVWPTTRAHHKTQGVETV